FVWLGRLEAMRGNLDAARAHVRTAKGSFEELDLSGPARDTCPRAFAAIELAAGATESAAEWLREACGYLEERGQTSVLATRAAELAYALYIGGHYEDAGNWTRIARQNAADDDLDAGLTRHPVEAMLCARTGHIEEAELIARSSLELAMTTDSPNRRAA